MKDDVWGPLSDYIPVEVICYGTLEAPVLNLAEKYEVPGDITISWSAVENAEAYEVYVYMFKGSSSETVFLEEVTETSVTIPAEDIFAIGETMVSISASAKGWKDSYHVFDPIELEAVADWNYHTNYTSYYGGAVLTGYLGSATEVTVPAQLGGYDVTYIDRNAFWSSNVTSVTLPSTVKTISNYAFYSCESLTKVVIPISVTSISSYAFYNCKNLTIYGYAGTKAEEYAAANNIPFIARESTQTAPDFTVEPQEVLLGSGTTVKVTDTEAESIRVFVDGKQIDTVDVVDGSASVNLYAYTLGEPGDYSVQISACFDGEWTALSEPVVVTVGVKAVLGTPEFEEIGTVPTRTALRVRWLPAENAEDYEIEVYNETDGHYYFNYWYTDMVDEDGWCYYDIAAEDIPSEGVYTVTVTALASGCEETSATISFTAVSAGEWLYTVGEDGVVITGYTGTDTVVQVPAQIDGVDVVAIGDGAFANNNNVTSVTLPDTVIVIGENAFGYCRSLTEVTLPAALKEIDDYVFQGCAALESISLPETLESIGDNAFYDCAKLEKLTIMPRVTVMGYRPFVGCDMLEIWGVYESEAERAALAEGIPFHPILPEEGVPEFTLDAEGMLPLGNPLLLMVEETTADVIRVYINGEYHNDYDVTDGYMAVSYSEYTLGEPGVYTFSIRAKYGELWTEMSEEKALEVVSAEQLDAPVVEDPGTVPPRRGFQIRWLPVDKAESYEVELCKEGSSQLYVPFWDESFVDGDGYCYAEVPNCWCMEKGIYTLTVIAKAENLVQNETTLSLTVDADFDFLYTILGDHVAITGYVGMDNDAEVPAEIEGKPVEIIAVDAFSGDYCLTSVTLPDTLVMIESNSFDGCRSLTDISIPEGVSYVGDFAFGSCSDLTRVELPATLEYLGNMAFAGCEDLTEVVILSETVEIQSMVFMGSSNVEIWGYLGSTAQTYAEENNIVFHPLNRPQMEMPMITAEESVLLHASIAVSWSAPEGVQHYAVTITDPAGELLLSEETMTETNVSVSTDDESEAGVYTVTVVASGEGFDPSEPAVAQVELVCLGTLDQPVFDETRWCVGNNYSFTWKDVPNAQRYVVTDAFMPNNYITTGDNRTSGSVRADQAVGAYSVTIQAWGTGYRSSWYTGAVQVVPEYEYTVVDGEAVITAYNGSDESLLVPATLGGYPVTTIGPSVFEDNLTIVNVTLPKSVTVIEEKAFKNCASLMSIIGNGVKSIGREAFYGCVSLVDMDFNLFNGDGAHGTNSAEMYIGDDAFAGVKLPENTLNFYIAPAGGEGGSTSSDTYSYSNNPFIGIATLGIGHTSIPARAFYNADNLNTVYLPPTMERVGSEAFADCDSLQYVHMDDSLESIADDAFAMSPGVSFIIYTSDLETVSYAMQYAIDHEIPYRLVRRDTVMVSDRTLNYAQNEFWVLKGQKVTLNVFSAYVTDMWVELDGVEQQRYTLNAYYTDYQFTYF